MSSTPSTSAADDAKTKARKTAATTPLENAQTLRGIYISEYEFPNWVLDKDRWNENSDDKSHKFDDTIVVYDDGSDLNQVKELVEKREPVNVCIHGVMQRSYKQDELEKNFGWKTGAYGKSTSEQLYPNIGIYCHARVTHGVKSKEEKDVHVMNLIGYGFDSQEQPDYQYFLNKYGGGKDSLKNLDPALKQKFKEELIQRYRKIWLKACYICKFKGLKHLWYYGVGNGNFSGLLPPVWAGEKNFYNEIFAEAFGINPTDSSQLHSTNDGTNLDIPINFCKTNGVDVQNLQFVSKPDDSTLIPQVLFNDKSDPTNTLYINAWDPWSIIGNENEAYMSLDSIWGRNSNMSVLGWSMTNSKLLPDIVDGGDSGRKSKILSMKEILAQIETEDSSKGAGKAPVSGDSTPLPSTPSCNIDTSGKNITGITTECQDAIFSLVTAPVIVPPTDTDEPTEMSNLVSAIGTTYSSEYAIEGKNIKNPDDQTIMPAGSATLLYIGDTELFNVKPHSTTTKTNVKIKYMIQASPAKAGNKSDVSRDITKDTISNSVMNSLILAAKNGVETIIFPFIGGELFYGALKTKVDTKNASTSGYKEYDTDQHAEVLVKGVTDFYTNFSSYGIKSNPIKEIYFVTYNTPEKIISHKDGTSTTIPEVKEHEAIKKAYDNAKAKYLNLTSVLNQSIIGNVISNAIHYSTYPNIKPNIAIVNAANTQLQFGAGVSNMCYAGLTGNLNASDDNKSKSTYQIKLYTIKTKFIEAFTKYIANPSAASSSPPATSSKPKEDLGKVIEGLVNSIKETEDDYTKKLGINPSSGNFMYEYPPSDASSPPPPPVKEDKNLNSAQPTIEDMVTAFETAMDGADKNFYLGACGSIKAAYDLEMSGISASDASAEQAKMRAKLLLNLRKNSLLLKVPARWDYAEMQPGKVSGPPDNIKDLMNYSLQDTIEYYSQADVVGNAEFKALNIAEEPNMSWAFNTLSIGEKGKSGNATGVDKRFTKGFDNVLGVSCYFSTFLQLLLCDEDFLQLLIISICKQIDYSTSEKKFIIMKNLVDIFKLWFPIEIENIQTITSNIRDNVATILTELNMDTARENDVREVYDAFISNISEIDNNVYIQKFITNLKYNDNIVQNYEGISKPSVERNEKGYMLLIKPEIVESTTSETSKKMNTSIQELITDNEKEKVDTNFTLSKDDFVLNSNEYKLYKLYNNITKRGILSTIRNICNVKNNDKFNENSTKVTHLKTLNSFINLGEDGATDNTDYSYKNITKLITNPDYTKIVTDIRNILALVNKKFSNNIKNVGIDFDLTEITEQICTSANKIYNTINDKLDTLSKPTASQIKKTKVTIKQTHEYIVLDINRTIGGKTKNCMNVKIDPEVTICNKKYILRGYSFHTGDTINGGHYEFVKCNSLGNPALVLNDYGIMNLNDIETTTGGGKVNVTSEEVRQTGVSSLIYKKADSQAGGGFKPRHNATTTHTTSTSKSRHNSSFKASSSKSKGKSRNRSHTQRVK